MASAIALTASAAVAANAAQAATLTGAGSTLVAPIEAEWAASFHAFFGPTVTYDGSGSLAGITGISSGAVDFGASDAPMTSSQAAACHGCHQIPWAMSAIGIGFHINGIGNRLRLTGPVIAKIYLGQITQWNDRQIASLNPRTHLPSLKITPIFSSDGETYVFTRYLSAVSANWRTRFGTGTSVSFPTGIRGVGDLGVTALLQSTNGSIGYDGPAYLISHKLPAAAVRNAAGNFVYPNLSNIGAAGSAVKHVPPSGILDIVNPPRSIPFAYPISTFTYVIAPGHPAQRSLLSNWILYAVGSVGEAFGPALDFPRLPLVVAKAATALARGL